MSAIRSLRFAIYLRATPHQVRAVLNDPALMPRWLAGTQFHTDAEDDPQRLSCEWLQTDHLDANGGSVSVVRLEFVAMGQVTRLTVIHRGLVSDGSFLYIYTPADHRGQKMKPKDSMAEEMQAPLAFLLGKLNFDKEFKNIQAHPDGSDLRITGEPKDENLPYSSVDFVVTPQNQIRKLKITLPAYTLEFAFTLEKMDPTLDAKLFVFQLPPGAQWDEASR